jgi:hypothetical protein
LIHSYVFLVVGAYDSGVDGPFGFYLNSDKRRERELRYLDWESYKQIVRAVARADDGHPGARRGYLLSLPPRTSTYGPLLCQ